LKDVTIKELTSLVPVKQSNLVKESVEEGFRFLERLVKEYERGINRFDQKGEGLYGVFIKGENLVAVGGITIDPFSNDHTVGRLRRFYVSRAHRRNGMGELLLSSIVKKAQVEFRTIVLHTDTMQGHRFYTAFGFERNESYPKSTHLMTLDRAAANPDE